MTKAAIIVLAAIGIAGVLFCVVGWSLSWYYDRRGDAEPIETEKTEQ